MSPIAIESTKKRKLVSEPKQLAPSKIFSPFRTIGLVTDETPLAVTSLGQSYLITTVVDRSFQIYDASNLHLLFVSQPRTPSKITYIHSHFHYVYASWARTVGIYRRGNLENTITLPDDDETDINNILLFGEYLCVSSENCLYVFKSIGAKATTNFEFYTSFKVPQVLGQIKQLIHLPTYLNKIVIAVGSSVLLYNIRSGKLLFTSEDFGSPITAIEASPVLDILGISTTTGYVSIYNIRKGRTLFSFSLDEYVKTISFRSDGIAHLAIGSSSGNIYIYDLNQKRRIHSVRGAHDETAGGVSKVQYLNGQSIIISNGGDNLIQELVFDPAISNSTNQVSSPPRVLRSRGGHSKPATVISFTDEEAHFILSASQDRSLWSFSLRKDSQSHEFSQKTASMVNGKRVSKQVAGYGLIEKFSEITDFAYQADKQKRWDNIITAHKNLPFARTWSGDRGIVGKFQLNTIDGGIVKSVGISQCGNFGLVGSSQGSIAVYNLQSGVLRRKLFGHKKNVSGVTIDSLNKYVISCSLDGNILIHNFHNGLILSKIQLDASCIQMKFHHRSNLLAIALDNLSIVVIDIQTKKIIRELWGHSNTITSFDFTPDGRWIISASLDSTIRTWDIPSGGCIDAVKVDNIVTCLRISPNNEWLATSHVQGSGVQLWTLKSQFQKISTRIISEDEINNIILPNSTGEGGSNVLDGALEISEEVTEDNTDWNSPEQLDNELQTLSLLPKSKLNTLVHLDIIKLRNKPKEAPKVPEKAPFFLGIPGSESDKKKEEPEGSFNQPKLTDTVSSESKFTQLLRQNEYDEFIQHLRSLPPSATDLEIRSLNTFPPLTEFICFINALSYQLQKKKDYELIQAWMSMLLRIHGDVILANSTNEQLLQSLASFEKEQLSESQRLDKLAKYCSGVLNYLRTA